MYFRALLVWCLLFALEAVHGALRVRFLVPLTTDLLARQIGVAVGSALILAVAWFTVRWIAAPTRAAWWRVGALWLALMLAAEVTLGRWAFGYPWARIAEDFDPRQGGLLGFGMLVLFIAPWAMARLRGLSSAGL
jgi:hypothetical protein